MLSTDDKYRSRESSNLIIAFEKEPYGNCKVRKTVKISSQERYTVTWPISDVVKSLVKKGIVKNAIPF